jgi:single-strand DNA-binding protein
MESIMASFNRVILIGNLVRDIEIRHTTNAKLAVCQNAIAVNDRRKNAAGEWVDETSFVDLTFFGRTAELVGQYLTKGSPVFVEGKLKQDTWEKDGQKRSKLYVIVERMQFLTGKSEGSKGDGAQKTATNSRFSDPNGYSGAPDSVQHPEIHEEPVYNDGEMPF